MAVNKPDYRENGAPTPPALTKEIIIIISEKHTIIWICCLFVCPETPPPFTGGYNSDTIQRDTKRYNTKRCFFLYILDQLLSMFRIDGALVVVQTNKMMPY